MTSQAYDETPYPDLSYSQSHPDRLAVLAAILGLRPARLDRSRILEVGCAGGGNLIPMAYSLPGSEFVGIDYSLRQVTEAQAKARKLGLKNVNFKHLDILDVGGQLGAFDYIIAHGVYSWVPPDVRASLLRLCKQHLAPQGVAYVSYNTYPGWHMLGAVREMMLYHTRRAAAPERRAAKARDLLAFLTKAVPAEGDVRSQVLMAYVAFLNAQLDRLGKSGDAFLLHDELEQDNDPVYFHQFVEHAAEHGLQFMAEAGYRSSRPEILPKETLQALSQMANDIVETEQYFDFLFNQTFRQTLLCHAEVKLDRVVKLDRLKAFHIASRAVPASEKPDVHSDAVEKFAGTDGATLSTNHPVSKAAMVCLAERWPRSLPFDTLLAAARDRAYAGNAAAAGDLAVDAELLGANLLKGYSYHHSLVQLHGYVAPVAARISRRPVASPVARLQAEQGLLVTNVYHDRIELDQFTRFLVPYVDGSRDREALVDILLRGPVADGTLRVRQDDQPVKQPEDVRAVLADEVERYFGWLYRTALLVH